MPSIVGERSILARGLFSSIRLRDAFPVLCLILGVLGPAPALLSQEFRVSDIYSEAGPSVVLVIALDRHQQTLALGSGFFVDDDGAVVTNYHVIKGAAHVRIKSANTDDAVPIEGFYVADPTFDLAVLKSGVRGSQPLALAAERPTIGEPVVAIGNPYGLEATVSEGIISGIRTVGDLELYQTTAPISPGSSGGPVLNSAGETIGVATMSMEGGQNLNFAVPSSALADLWRPNLPVKKLVNLPSDGRRQWTFGLAHDEGVRLVDTRLDRDWMGMKPSGSVYNGSQFEISTIRILAVCFRRGVDVPIDFSTATAVPDFTFPKSLPPGLSVPFATVCSERTTHFDLRLLDYDIVR